MGQHLFRQGLAHLIGGLHRRFELAEKHAGIHHQMQVVAAGGGVEIERPGVVEILPVGRDGLFAGDFRFLVFAAENIGMPGHMAHMTRIRLHVAQKVG